VKHQRRSSDPTTRSIKRRGAQPDEDLDPVRWGILSEMIIAASRGDRYAGHRATQRLASEVPDDGVAGTYLYYLIHHRVRELSGPRPSAEDLQRLALAIYPNSRVRSVLTWTCWNGRCGPTFCLRTAPMRSQVASW
jgi:hypothetical protein